MQPDKLFYVGETVHLSAQFSDPKTRKAVDPTTVQLTRLQKRGGVALVIGDPNFTKIETGDYEHVIATTGFEAGVYDLIVTAQESPSRIVFIPDYFVLKVL